MSTAELLRSPFALTRRFLPEALARTAPLVFLTGAEQRTLNQLRGRRHVAMLAAGTAAWRGARLTAPITSAATAHLAMLGGFGAEVSTALGLAPLAGAPIALPRSPLATALLLLHHAWSSQLHHADGLADADLDVRFREVLAVHWQLAAQQIERLARHLDALAPALPGERVAAVDDCVAHLTALDAVAGEAVATDVALVRQLTGRRLGARETARAMSVQRASMRWNHLGAGLTHPRFTQLVARFAPERSVHLAALGAACL